MLGEGEGRVVADARQDVCVYRRRSRALARRSLSLSSSCSIRNGLSDVGIDPGVGGLALVRVGGLGGEEDDRE